MWKNKGYSVAVNVSLTIWFQVVFYESSNLLDWSPTGEFGGEGCCDEEWECPNLTPLDTPDGSHKWCLLVSVGGKKKGFPPGVQYFIGKTITHWLHYYLSSCLVYIN